MSEPQVHGEVVVEEVVQRQDVRVEMKAKNNILWHAIFDKYKSVNALCKAHPEVKFRQSDIGLLLRFKISPFKSKYGQKEGASHLTTEYRSVCLLLERILKVPAERLFPKHLYEVAVGRSEQVLEVSSFTALPVAVQRELRLLPALAEPPEAEIDRGFLRERLKSVLYTLSYREREIIKLRYGLDDGYTYTLEEVSHIFKVTPQRIRQLEAKAMRKLQQPSRVHRLTGFLD